MSFSSRDQEFFDPKIFFVLFFDQRGCGKSLPTGRLTHNTTEELIEDMHNLLALFEISKCVLFGGSWGSSLALLFAIKYPENVRHIIIRGFFPANRACRAYFEEGGSAILFPKAWERYVQLVPLSKRENIPQYYFEKINSADKKQAEKYAFECQVYGMSIDGSEKSPDVIESAVRSTDFVTKSKIQCYYSANYFFIPDNYIYDQVQNIIDLPIDIIHGLHDKICDVKYARQLHELLPNSKLIEVEAAHSSFDPLIKAALMHSLERLQ